MKLFSTVLNFNQNLNHIGLNTEDLFLTNYRLNKTILFQKIFLYFHNDI